MDYEPEPLNLYRPAHLIANELIRRIEARNGLKFGDMTHADITALIQQYQDKLDEEYKKGFNDGVLHMTTVITGNLPD